MTIILLCITIAVLSLTRVAALSAKRGRVVDVNCALIMIMMGSGVIGAGTANATQDQGWHGRWVASVGVGIKTGERELPWSDNGYAKQPTASFAVGAEFNSGLSIKYVHRSNWFVGAPFNDHDEYWVDEIKVSYKFDLGGF